MIINMMTLLMMMIQETLAKEEAENQKKALELRDLQVGIKCSPIHQSLPSLLYLHWGFFLAGVSNAGPKIKRSGLNLCGSIYLTKVSINLIQT